MAANERILCKEPLVFLQLRKLGKSLRRLFPALGTKVWPLSSSASFAAVPASVLLTICLDRGVANAATLVTRLVCKLQASSF